MSVYKRAGATTYTADFQYRGQRVSRDTGIRSKREAEKWVQEYKAKIDELKAIEARMRGPNADMTIGEAVGQYVVEKLQYSRSYLVNEQYVVPKIVERLGPEKKLSELRRQISRATWQAVLCKSKGPRSRVN